MTKPSSIDDEIVSDLQSIHTMTGTLCELAASGEYLKVAGMLHERETLIASAKKSHDRLLNNLQNTKMKTNVRQNLQSLMSQIRASDERLLEILQKQKNIVLGKLQETQRQQSLQAYSR